MEHPGNMQEIYKLCWGWAAGVTGSTFRQHLLVLNFLSVCMKWPGSDVSVWNHHWVCFHIARVKYLQKVGCKWFTNGALHLWGHPWTPWRTFVVLIREQTLGQKNKQGDRGTGNHKYNPGSSFHSHKHNICRICWILYFNDRAKRVSYSAAVFLFHQTIPAFLNFTIKFQKQRSKFCYKANNCLHITWCRL